MFVTEDVMARYRKKQKVRPLMLFILPLYVHLREVFRLFLKK